MRELIGCFGMPIAAYLLPPGIRIDAEYRGLLDDARGQCIGTHFLHRVGDKVRRLCLVGTDP